MITFSNLGSLGRLGNQLFQYAILKKISLITNYNIELPHNVFNNVWHGQRCLLNHFKLPSCTFKNDLKIENFYMENGFQGGHNFREYNENIFKIKDNSDIAGFFQNPKYYEDIKNELIKELEIENDIQIKITSILQQYNSPTVSLHIRRGDVSDGTSIVDYQWANRFDENSIQYKYYNKALELIPKNSNILLFTGGSRTNNNEKDYEWCQRNFIDKRIKIIKGLNDIETFHLMSRCDYNITSFASTFSWWASFLNSSDRIIAPKEYYPNQKVEIEKVYPKNWTLI